MDTQSHEQLLQTLSALLIQVNALQTLVEDEQLENMGKAGIQQKQLLLNIQDMQAVRTGLATVEQMTRDALHVVRSDCDEMPLPELEGVTLVDALSRLVEETAETLGLSSRVSFSGVDEQGRPKEHELCSAAERILFLIAREALYEVQLRTGARKVRLTLNYGQEDVQMGIEDDGLVVGIPLDVLAHPEPVYDAPALPFMGETLHTVAVQSTETAPVVSIMRDLRARIEQLGGTLEISSPGERGTRLLARVHYTQHAQTATIAPLAPAPSTSTAAMTLTSAKSTQAAVSVLVVDSHAVIRAGLHRLLESYDGIHVVGEAADGVQAVSETLELGPQVVLMDSHLPNGQSMEALRQIKQLNADTKVLLLSAQDREEYLYETLRAGADGYVLKDIAPDELVQAVRAVARGEVQVQAQLAGKLLSRFGKQGRGTSLYESLTTRELEVLRLLARGLRNKEIASRLYVSERTVNFHLANIYQKLNVSGRTEALSRALEQGLISA